MASPGKKNINLDILYQFPFDSKYIGKVKKKEEYKTEISSQKNEYPCLGGHISMTYYNSSTLRSLTLAKRQANHKR